MTCAQKSQQYRARPNMEPGVIEAEPELFEIYLQKTAVMVIDMQNAFVSKEVSR